MINVEEVKQEKQEKKILVCANLLFFAMYQNIVQVIIEAIKPEFEELKKYSQS